MLEGAGALTAVGDGDGVVRLTAKLGEGFVRGVDCGLVAAGDGVGAGFGAGVVSLAGEVLPTTIGCRGTRGGTSFVFVLVVSEGPFSAESVFDCFVGEGDPVAPAGEDAEFGVSSVGSDFDLLTLGDTGCRDELGDGLHFRFAFAFRTGRPLRAGAGGEGERETAFFSGFDFVGLVGLVSVGLASEASALCFFAAGVALSPPGVTGSVGLRFSGRLVGVDSFPASFSAIFPVPFAGTSLG